MGISAPGEGMYETSLRAGVRPESGLSGWMSVFGVRGVVHVGLLELIALKRSIERGIYDCGGGVEWSQG